MDAPVYTATGYRSVRSTDGDAFTVTLRLDGKKIGAAMNSGTGGPNTYDLDRDAQAALDAAARAWAAENGEDATYEVADLFVEHLINEGQLAKHKAANLKRGYAITVVVRKSEWEDEIIGLRTEADVARVEAQNPGKKVRVL